MSDLSIADLSQSPSHSAQTEVSTDFLPTLLPCVNEKEQTDTVAGILLLRVCVSLRSCPIQGETNRKQK